jgi:hypothetical protein
MFSWKPANAHLIALEQEEWLIVVIASSYGTRRRIRPVSREEYPDDHIA